MDDDEEENRSRLLDSLIGIQNQSILRDKCLTFDSRSDKEVKVARCFPRFRSLFRKTSKKGIKDQGDDDLFGQKRVFSLQASSSPVIFYLLPHVLIHFLSSFSLIPFYS